MPTATTALIAENADAHAAAVTVLTTLGRGRFAAVDSLLAYARPLGITVADLDRWTEAGLVRRGAVRCDPIAGADVPYVVLTTRGARALAEATSRPVEGVSPAALRRSSQKRAHDLAVADLGLAALALGRSGQIDLLGVELDDRKLATAATVTATGHAPRRVPLQADALVMTHGPRGPVALLVEVDRGTTSVAKMRDKYAAYLAWRRDGGPERDFSVRALRVLTVAPDGKRSRRLHDAALDANGGKRSGFLLFAEQADVSPGEPERLLTPIAKPLDGASDTRVPILDRRFDAEASRPPGSRADDEFSPRARMKSSTRLGIPAPPRLPAAAGLPVPPVL